MRLLEFGPFVCPQAYIKHHWSDLQDGMCIYLLLLENFPGRSQDPDFLKLFFVFYALMIKLLAEMIKLLAETSCWRHRVFNQISPCMECITFPHEIVSIIEGLTVRNE